ncbi:DUF5018-related domain-containing protein [Chitinophaga rhizosphaerae]|uniref:DUF5018-related domain-containing protein n=1 Tax=Chitinophaga rhizosphaerae TaxID=1864947 RepID=UPI000F803C8D|nr:hypothetical protein [Chitinophaga rhizosphaerae]
MKKCIQLACYLIVLAAGSVSCMKPRIELDKGAWGDNANITAAVLFKYIEVTNNLGYGEPVTGYQNSPISTITNTVDKAAATVTLVAVKGTDITKMGIRFSHYAVKIEPLNGAPAAGTIADFSKGDFMYRLTSADGTVRDWKILVSVAP